MDNDNELNFAKCVKREKKVLLCWRIKIHFVQFDQETIYSLILIFGKLCLYEKSLKFPNFLNNQL